MTAPVGAALVQRRGATPGAKLRLVRGPQLGEAILVVPVTTYLTGSTTVAGATKITVPEAAKKKMPK